MSESAGDDKSVKRFSKEIAWHLRRINFLSFCNLGLFTSVLVDWVDLQRSKNKDSRFGHNSMMTGISTTNKCPNFRLLREYPKFLSNGTTPSNDRSLSNRNVLTRELSITAAWVISIV
jgi:hypothetical protein